jgi:hypothetical protein
MEPRPSRPSKGSGEAVWGRLAPAACWSEVALFCALTSPDFVALVEDVALCCALISLVVEELLGAAAALLFWALMSELVLDLDALESAGGLVLLVVLLWALISEVLAGVWLAEAEPEYPTPLELAACDGVAVDGGVFWVWAAALPSAELVWPGVLALLVAGACSLLVAPGAAELVWLELLPIAFDEEVEDCEAELSAVIAPVVPPAAAPVPSAAEPPPEQVSLIFVMFEAVSTLFDDAVVLLAPLLPWAFADELPEVEPLIETVWPTWLCSWLLSPCTWYVFPEVESVSVKLPLAPPKQPWNVWLCPLAALLWSDVLGEVDGELCELVGVACEFWSGGMVLLGLLLCGTLWLALVSVELLDDELDDCASATAVANSRIAVTRVSLRMKFPPMFLSLSLGVWV